MGIWAETDENGRLLLIFRGDLITEECAHALETALNNSGAWPIGQAPAAVLRWTVRQVASRFKRRLFRIS
ncbi:MULTISPECIES: hypothetical protein [Streptomycetaceae]|uniref:hypothetical protein n=1 Tax=Streptomycetaceae TaxID=2062 RepID=UPI0012FF9F97|nr:MULTISPECIES: hypothetical protein [Streptomycetaceae]MYS59294.1 hypothetical protein [Streptomyces sp. SID5468]